MATVFQQNVNGNSPLVAEWCYDYYADFGTGELTNPVHEQIASYITGDAMRIIRGNSLRSASYFAFYLTFHSPQLDRYGYCYFPSIYSSVNLDCLKGIRPARNAE